MPLVTDVPSSKAIKLDGPLLHIEVQLGALTARGRDGFEGKGKAGETIDGDLLKPPIELTASESPCRVKVWQDSEARGFEARQKRTG